MGVELCPVPDGKESADKAIIMDALLFAFDHKPCPDTPAVDQLTPQGNQGMVNMHRLKIMKISSIHFASQLR